MSKYIDQDVLLEKMQERYEDIARDYGDYDNYVMGFSDAIELLENAPAADVQEVKHAEWNYYTKTNYICSSCNFIRNIETQIGWKYCPMCGAKTDLEDENEH